jgi:hypothetical protein
MKVLKIIGRIILALIVPTSLILMYVFGPIHSLWLTIGGVTISIAIEMYILINKLSQMELVVGALNRIQDAFLKRYFFWNSVQLLIGLSVYAIAQAIAEHPHGCGTQIALIAAYIIAGLSIPGLLVVSTLILVKKKAAKMILK